MKDIRPNWHDDIVWIKNKVNVALRSMATTASVNRYFSETDVYYVALNPAPEVDRHNAATPVTETEKWLKDVKNRLEEEAFDKQISRIMNNIKAGDKQVKEGIRLKTEITFGVNKTVTALEKKVDDSVRANLPEVEQRLKRILQDKNSELTLMDSKIQAAKPSVTRGLYYEYIINLIDKIRSIMDFKYVYSTDNELVLNPFLYAQSFEKELEDAHMGKNDVFEGLPDFQGLLDILENLRETPTGPLTQVRDYKLGGNAAKYRFLQVFGIIFLSLELHLPSPDEQFNAGLTSVNGISSSVDAKQMLHNTLQGPIIQLNRVVDWLCNHLQYLMYRHYDHAAAILLSTPQFKAIRDHDSFHMKVTAAFKDLVDAQIKEVRFLVQRMIRDYSQVIPMDCVHRQISMLALAPIEPINEIDEDSKPSFVDTVADSVMYGISASIVEVQEVSQQAVTQVSNSIGNILKDLRKNSVSFPFDVQDLLNTGK